VLIDARYRVLGPLGEGGLGAALHVVDEATDREVCLKRLRVRTLENARAMRAEFEALRGFVHPGLARVLDYGIAREADGARSPYLTSELVRGPALDVFARGRPFSEVLGALAAPLAALHVLHRHRVAHGDFKPSNVLVDAASRKGRLIDLSCARALGAPAPLSGTRGFIAPELLAGETGDARADVYSVGATLLTLAALAREPSPSAVRLARQMTSDRPEERPSTIDEVMDLLGLEGAAFGSTVVEARALFGRERLLSAVRDAIGAVVAGASGPRVLVVRGPAGSGRSRVLRELTWNAQLDLAVVEGFAGSPDAVRSMLARAVGEPELPGTVLGAMQARALLEQRREPTLLVLDDADRLTDDAGLLRQLARVLQPDDPIALLVSTLDGAGSFGEEVATATWDLEPLPDEAARAWLAEAGIEGDPCATVLRAARGSPGAVADAIRALRAGVPASDLERATVREGGGARRGPPLPSDPSALDSLALLAVALEPVDPAWIDLASCRAFPGLVVQEAGLSLARDVAADLAPRLDVDTRRAAHRRHADALIGRAANEELAPARRSSLVARRAYHLASAGREEDALSLFEASESLRRVAPRAWIDPARALSTTAAGTRAASTLARAMQQAGEPRLALATLRASSSADAKLAAACLLEMGEPREAIAALSTSAPDAEVCALLARAHLRQGAYAEALTRALAGLEQQPSREQRSELHECAGVASLYSNELAAAREHLDKAKAASAGGEDPRRLVRVLSYDAMLAFRRGDLDGARASYQHALGAAETHGVADQIPRACLNLATACHQRGELAVALETYGRGESLARALDQRDLLLVFAFDTAKLFADIGALDRAKAKAERALDEARARGSTFFEAALDSVLADVALAEGEIERAREGFARARAVFARDHASREVAEEDLELARVALAVGDLPRVRELVAAARAAPGFSDAADLVARAGLIDARLALLDGDAALARKALSTVIADADRAHLVEAQARALVAMADVATRQGLPGEATELVSRARALWSGACAGLPAPLLEAFWQRPERAGARREQASDPPARPSRPSGSARLERAERLIAAFRRLNASVEIADVLAMAIDEAIALTAAERGFVLLDPKTGDELQIAVARNMDRGSIDHEELRFSRGIAERAIATAQPVVTLDARSDARFQANVSVHAIGLRSVIAVPIRSPEGVLGALYLDNRYASARFDRGDEDLLLAFADQVAIALRNARLVEALRKRQEELDAERRRVEELARGQAIEIDRLHEEVRRRQEVLEHRFDYSAIVGRAPALQKMFAVLDRVIDSPLAVLVTGESGTGKELVARAIHFGSRRRAGPFVGINCAALPATLLESELFGHAKGAFTGADRDRPGLVVAASGGTLFLDELGEMQLDVQAKLLRVLQEREVRPIGANRSVAVDFRLVCATNRDLRQDVARGRFREDLYYRVGVVEVRIPALRERATDIPELAIHFAQRAAEQLGRSVLRFHPSALRKLATHPFPGNVRELENVVTKAVVLAEGDTIGPEDVELGSPGAPRPAPPSARGGGPRSRDRATLVTALEATGWNAVRAAKDLGIPRATFYRRLKALGLERPPR